MRIIRVFYHHPNDPEKIHLNDCYVDFKLADNTQNVKKIELLDVIPESVKTYKVFLDDTPSKE